MSTFAQRRGYAGVTQLRRKLRRLHEVTENSIKPVLEDIANDIARDMRGLTPVREGTAVGAIEYDVGRDGLTAKIGIVNQNDARVAFYFRFLDGGTKGSAEHNMPPMPALNIRSQAFDANKGDAIRRLQVEINRTLARVANSD